tara:strand:- start:69 stop:350 length:282 start_codon:yes stop_codon:yes gene_type:complete
MQTVTTALPKTPEEANALYKKAGEVLSKPKKAKKIGVVGVSKAENVQLGLILKEIAYQFNEYKDGSDIYLPSSVLVDPEALIKLFGRYQNKAK